ncbi:MAG: N,N-dimethylformamidase beta subunit family domain-containing protein [Roseiarcus sp.]
MKLTGYSDIWSVRAGDSVGFHIHSEASEVDVQLVRLLHGDENPRGPGFLEIKIASSVDGRHAAGPRQIHRGSFALLETEQPLLEETGFRIDCWVWPTLPGAGSQGLISWRAPDSPAGLCLALDEHGRVIALSGDRELVGSREALAPRAWAHIELAALNGRLSLSVAPRDFSPRHAEPDRGETIGPLGGAPLFGRRLSIAAADAELVGDRLRPLLCFNGKLARPRFRSGSDIRCAFDFAIEPGGRDLVDRQRGLVAKCFNRPARAMTGPAFGARGVVPASPTHDAVHFHDDDVSDVGWPETFRFAAPADLPSGVYAMRLRSGAAEDHLPFIVAPSRGRPGGRLALMMPTFSYLAYANESLDVSTSLPLAPLQDMGLNSQAYAYVAANGLKSIYDLHADGSGISLGTRRRPIIDFRPKARCRTFDAPHQFAADLHLIHWLHGRGYEVDVISDDMLHAEGVGLLAPYRAVLTGTHPEYWTTRMLDARDEWLDAGGRLLYVGGNGFYWVTAVAEDEPDVIEIRRYGGTGTWQGEPGEDRLALSGERGGLWRMSGRPPQARLGVGFCGQGFDRGAPYRKTTAAADPRWSWIFSGVDGAVFGAGRSLVLGHGAAGFEIDRADPAAGTPEHTVVLASADGFTDAYQTAMERVTAVAPWLGGSDPRSGLRADMTITRGPNGGAVFATGSISYCATLSFENGQSDTARILANVIDGFLADVIPGG